jgi:hypothetical protein
VLRIDVRHDLDKLISTLGNVRREQLPYAIAVAVTRTAQVVKRALTTEMLYAFDRPTPYTMGSLFLSSATKSMPVAKVWLKDDAGKGTPASKYLLPEIIGGERRYKRFERALAATGLLPTGMYAMPGAAAKIDRFGNMERGQVVQILSALRAGETRAGYQANRTQRSAKRQGQAPRRVLRRQARGGRLPLGIWQRFGFAHGSAIKPVAIFTRAPQYKQRFRFQEIADEVVRDEFGGQFMTAYSQAVATAR